MQTPKPLSDAALRESSPAKALPRVAMETPLGLLILELDTVRAPLTTVNFLRYLDAGAYTGGQFHRTVTPENQPQDNIRIGVIQGSARLGFREWAPIPLEPTKTTGISHLDGVISMARSGPDTATHQFFLCVGDQPELDHGGRRNPDGQGFAAFGRLVEGWLAVRRIQMSPAEGQTLRPPISILRARRL